MTHKSCLALAAAILLLGCQVAKSTGIPTLPDKEIQIMQTAQPEPARENVINLLRLTDSGYFDIDETIEDELTGTLIVMDDFEGIAIGAPRAVDIEARSTLPLLWARRASGLRNWQVEPMRNAIVVVSDLSRGRISSHYAFAGPKRIALNQIDRSAMGDIPGRDVAEGVTAGLETLDLRAIANLPWQPGRYAVTLIMHDWISNTVLVELTRHGRGLTPEEESALRLRPDDALRIEEEYRNMLSDGKGQKGAAPQSTPLRLEKTGVAVFSLPGQVSPAEAIWPLAGGARLELQPGNIVDRPGNEAALTAMPDKPPAAVLHLMLLLLELDNPLPRRIPIQVPISSEKPVTSGIEVAATFSVNLKSLVNELPAGKTLQLYLVGGKHISGPRPLVVSGEGGP